MVGTASMLRGKVDPAGGLTFRSSDGADRRSNLLEHIVHLWSSLTLLSVLCTSEVALEPLVI